MEKKVRGLSRKIIVGVTGPSKKFSPSWISIKNILIFEGMSPVRISTHKREPHRDLDALILSGGDDIHPMSFSDLSADPKQQYDQKRDQLEIEYASVALNRNIPVLGICRGYQLLNLLGGGTLYKDISEISNIEVPKRTLFPCRSINIYPKSKLESLVGKRSMRVNSLHHQAIKNLSKNYRVSSKDSKGLIQSIEHKSAKVIGVQWHPEYLFYLSSNRSIFKWLKNSF